MPVTKSDLNRFVKKQLTIKQVSMAFLPDDNKLKNAKCFYYITNDGIINPLRSPIFDLIQDVNYKDDHKLKSIKDNTVFYYYPSGLTKDMDKGIAAINKFDLEYLEHPKEGTINNESEVFKLITAGRWTEDPLLQIFKVVQSDTGSSSPNAATFINHTSTPGKQIIWSYLIAVYSLIIARVMLGTKGYVIIQGKNIGAILTDMTGAVKSWGLNTNDLNSTFHAETNCLQGFINNGGNPSDVDDGYLFVSHQPCKMCAGVISSLGAKNLKVYFAQADNSQNAQQNFLNLGTQMFLINQQDFIENPVEIKLNENSTNCESKTIILELIKSVFSKTTFDNNNPVDRVLEHLKVFLSKKGYIPI
jgi:tRNA(Arg) A34 adenosine deaminase TadA